MRRSAFTWLGFLLAFPAMAMAKTNSRHFNLFSGSSPRQYLIDGYRFSYAGCTMDGTACSRHTNAQVVIGKDSRGNTTVLIRAAGRYRSNILSSSRGGHRALAFNLSIMPQTLHRFSRIIATVSGSAPTTARHAVAATISASNISGGSLTTTLASTSSGATIVPVPGAQTLSIALSLPASSATSLSLNTLALTLASPVPEPATLAMLGTGLIGLVAIRHRRRRIGREGPGG